MKITENTDRRLIIEHRPWLLAGTIWLLGFAALYSGIAGANMGSLAQRLLVLAFGVTLTFAAWQWFPFLRITFDRDLGELEHRSLRPIGSRSRYLRLDRIRQARIEATWNDNRTRLTRLSLDTDDGITPLEYGYGSGDRRSLENAVNEWLTRPVRTASADVAP